MPQDIRVSPDGSTFYVADMMADGVFVVDGASFKEIGFVKTGKGTHGLYPSRDGRKLYVANRGSNKIHGAREGMGSVSVLDFATRTVDVTWPIPGGGSPDMGNVSADGKWLWLSGRYDNVVYAIDTTSGAVKIIRSAASRTVSPSGRSRAATRSATPATCAERAAGPGRGTRASARRVDERRDRGVDAVAAAGDALHVQRRLDAGEAAEDHRLVDVAHVADAKDAARERAEAAGDRDLEALARDRAHAPRGRCPARPRSP